MAKKIVKKVVKRAKIPEDSGESTAEDMDEELDSVLSEVEEIKKEVEKEKGEKKEKKSLFGRGAPAPILKLPVDADVSAMAYGKKQLERVKKELEKTTKILEVYPVREPYSYTIIGIDLETREMRYYAVEPELQENEKKIYDFIVNALERIIKYDPLIVQNREVLEKYIIKKVDELMDDMGINLTKNSHDRILYYLLRDYIGYGKLQILMDDPNLEDISCDGVNVPIFVFHRKYEQLKTNIVYPHAQELDGFVVTLAQRAGRYISVADPILDTTMPDGSRINMTYGSEITTRGSTISIRKFNANPLTIPQLIKFGTMNSTMAAYLWLAVQYQESMLFVGGSASGKTATLNATAMFIPWESKIISIEDTREINIPQENWLPGVTRETGGRGGKDITMYSLLRAALRQRPEYLLVGEVRGEETMTMFQAMATGHTTYSTMHGESAEDVIHRLENPPINVPRVLLEALNQLIVHINVKIKGKRYRRIKEIREIHEFVPSTNEIKTAVIFKWEPAGDRFAMAPQGSKLISKIAERENMDEEDVLKELDRRRVVIDWLVENNITYYKDVTKVFQDYYADKANRFSDENKVYKAIKEGRGLELLGSKAH